MKRSKEDLCILNGFWFYRDGLITLETFLKVIENLKATHDKRMEEIIEQEEIIAKEMKDEK